MFCYIHAIVQHFKYLQKCLTISLGKIPWKTMAQNLSNSILLRLGPSVHGPHDHVVPRFSAMGQDAAQRSMLARLPTSSLSLSHY